MSPKTTLIPYACGAGAENKTCADGPQSLQKFGLEKLLQARNINAAWLDVKKIKDGATNIQTVAAHCVSLQNNVRDILQSGGFPVTIGGDHSMAIGTWTGVADSIYARRKLGLIWIDAHMDAHTSATSPSGNSHGMPISYLLGHGNDELAEITKHAAVIVPYQLCLIGVRSYEQEEAELLRSAGAKIYTIEQVQKRGLEEILVEAVGIVSKHTAGFGISIDIDAFDPKIAPGTGTIANNGLEKDEFCCAISHALSGYKNQLLALEIAEFNPYLDKDDMTAKLVVDVVAAVLRH